MRRNVMSQEEFQTLLLFFKALADENRLKMIGILAEQECSVEELAAMLHLKAIPASRKKRAVILKWFAHQFAEGVLYKESQVNETVKRHHIDAAFWRRELVGANLMQRENGFYWRVPFKDLP